MYSALPAFIPSPSMLLFKLFHVTSSEQEYHPQSSGDNLYRPITCLCLQQSVEREVDDMLELRDQPFHLQSRVRGSHMS